MCTQGQWWPWPWPKVTKRWRGRGGNGLKTWSHHLRADLIMIQLLVWMIEAGSASMGLCTQKPPLRCVCNEHQSSSPGPQFFSIVKYRNQIQIQIQILVSFLMLAIVPRNSMKFHTDCSRLTTLSHNMKQMFLSVFVTQNMGARWHVHNANSNH